LSLRFLILPWQGTSAAIAEAACSAVDGSLLFLGAEDDAVAYLTVASTRPRFSASI